MSAPRLLAPTTISGGVPTAGAGTLNTIALWTPDGNTLGNSLLTQSGSTISNNTGAIRATGTSAGAPAFTGADTDTGVYFPAANQMRFSTAGSPAMSIDATQQVGIGTTSPGYRLDVAVTTGVSSGAALSISAGAGNDIARWTANTATGEILFGQGRAAAGNYFLTFYTVGAERVRIDSNGNVGVGMTSGFSGKLGVLSANAISTADVTFSYDATGSYRHGFSNVFSSGTAANNTSTWLVWNAAGGQTQVMTANGAGNVGIGTASPQARLHVGAGTDAPTILATTIYASNPGSTAFTARNSTTDVEVYLSAETAGATLGTFTSHPLAIRTGNIDRITVLTTGEVGIGTASPASRLDVAGTITCDDAGTGLKLQGTAGTNNTDPNVLDFYADGGTANSGGVAWTPVLKFGGNTTGITYNTQLGRYTRIGNMVIASCYIRLTSKGTATGVATIDGLPACVNLASFYVAASIGYTAAITSTGTFQVNMSANQTQLTIRQVTAAGVNTAVTDADFANGSEIIVSISYPVN